LESDANWEHFPESQEVCDGLHTIPPYPKTLLDKTLG